MHKIDGVYLCNNLILCIMTKERAEMLVLLLTSLGILVY